MQDTILVIPPYPYCIEEKKRYSLGRLLVCSSAASLYLLPASNRWETPKIASYRCGPDDLCYHLVFFSTFEELKLPISGPMERAGVTKLYEPSLTRTPWLHVAPAANMVGRVPLIPLFLAGNSTPTIPHKYSKHIWEL